MRTGIMGCLRVIGAVCCVCSLPMARAAEFEPPVMMTAAGEPIRVESPGYAAPCWTDFDGDGQKDLLVGQFRDGKIRFFRNAGDGQLEAGRWVEAAGQVATVPGVW